jgi:hypothetical protein
MLLTGTLTAVDANALVRSKVGVGNAAGNGNSFVGK